MDKLELLIISLALELDSSVIKYQIDPINGSIRITKRIMGNKVSYTIKKKNER